MINSDIINQLDNLIREAMKNTPLASETKTDLTLSAMIKFTEEEIEQMGAPFKDILVLDGSVAHVIKYLSQKRKPLYEIRYLRHGINIIVVNKNLKKAKELFIQETVRVCAELNKT